jgi:hypothetical protein
LATILTKGKCKQQEQGAGKDKDEDGDEGLMQCRDIYEELGSIPAVPVGQGHSSVGMAGIKPNMEFTASTCWCQQQWCRQQLVASTPCTEVSSKFSVTHLSDLGLESSATIVRVKRPMVCGGLMIEREAGLDVMKWVSCKIIRYEIFLQDIHTQQGNKGIKRGRLYLYHDLC